MRERLVLLAAAIALGCGGGGGGGDAAPTAPGTGGNGPGAGGAGSPSGSATVSMRTTDDGYGYTSFAFSPTSVSITRGGTVKWAHDGNAAVHNVTFAPATGAPANVSNLSSGEASRTFNTAGTYSYSCTNHTGMTGTVVVQ